jgi:hypothetical protein
MEPVVRRVGDWSAGVFEEIPGDSPVMVIGPAASDSNAPSLLYRARALPLP